ncbi:MAG: hypothetical protein NC347_05295 [Clostridium sp.]|nr:hypothetical protein [Clostridium sp.]
MKYLKKKNIIVLLLLQVILWSLTGCGSFGENQADQGENYSEQFVVSDWRQDFINRICFHQDAVYFTTYAEVAGDGENYCLNRVYSVNQDGSGLKEIPIDLTKEEPLVMITGLMMNEDDTISIWLSSNDSTEANDIKVFVKVDGTGKELVRKDMNELVDGQYVGKACVMPQGQIAVMAEHSVYLFDESLEPVHAINIEGYAIGMALTGENQMVCAAENSDGKQRFQIMDMEQGKVTQTISLRKGESVNENAVFSSAQYDFCYRNDKGIYGYDIKNKQSTCLLNYRNQI